MVNDLKPGSFDKPESRRSMVNDLKPGSFDKPESRFAQRSSKAASAPGRTVNRLAATKFSASNRFLPSASTTRQPPSTSPTVLGGAARCSSPSKKIGDGGPFKTLSDDTMAFRNAPIDVPPWASLKASPLRHALKSFFSFQIVKLM